LNNLIFLLLLPSDRHWLTREFPSLLKPVLICELGCGVGNSTFPLLHENPTLRFHCCDFSAQAVDILRKNEKFNAANILSAFVADVSNTQQVLQVVPVHSCDAALFIFVLSAMPPEAVSRAICTAREVLKVGGEVLVRDYAEGDGAHVRYLETPASRVIDRNLCIRGDGTQAYFFPLDMLRRLFEEQGFDGTDCKVIDAEPSAQGGLPRKYVQGRFILKSHKG
jgi:SAM-dependent methyltransferase